jgi:choline dehydrogenase-like flavoprotein
MTEAASDDRGKEAQIFDYDVIVIGSGFGGSVSALRLTEKGYRVAVLESGKRFASDDYPKSNWNLRKFLYMPRLGMKGIQRLHLLSDVLVLSGAGVGGGSLVYANTLYEPLDGFYTDPQWQDITDWRRELAMFYDQSKRMLGATAAPDNSPNDAVIEEIGERMGVADTYRATDVGVYLAEPGRTDPDPYFGGAGPDRTGCIQCGACMIGCRHNAKNTLDRNYLYLAEQAGAVVHAEQRVVDLVALEHPKRVDRTTNRRTRHLLRGRSRHRRPPRRPQGARPAPAFVTASRRTRANQLGVDFGCEQREGHRYRLLPGCCHQLVDLSRRTHSHRRRAISRRIERDGDAIDDPGER